MEIFWLSSSLVMLGKARRWIPRAEKVEIRRDAGSRPLAAAVAAAVCNERRSAADAIAHLRQIAGPMSLGLIDPAILIPWAFLDKLSDAELDHIVMHELAHLQRRDDWTNLAQRFIEAVLPIQPAV